MDEHEEMQDKMEELRNLSMGERREKMQEIHEDFKNWLKEQEIDETIIGGFGKGFDNGFGKYGFGKQEREFVIGNN